MKKSGEKMMKKSVSLACEEAISVGNAIMLVVECLHGLAVGQDDRFKHPGSSV